MNVGAWKLGLGLACTCGAGMAWPKTQAKHLKNKKGIPIGIWFDHSLRDKTRRRVDKSLGHSAGIALMGVPQIAMRGWMGRVRNPEYLGGGF